MWGKVYRFFRRIKNILVFIFFLSFLVSILSNLVSPHTSIIVPPFGLLFIPFFLVNLGVFILYFRRNKIIAFTAIGLFILSASFIPRTLNLPKNQSQNGLKLMTWNVKNFDFYNWTKKKDTRQKMLALIDSLDPDVICFQEFFSNDFQHNNIKALQSIGYKNYSFYPSYSQSYTGNKWGLAIFSKHPISDAELIDLNPKKASMNQCMEATVHYKDKVYHIYNAHFQSIHLDYNDYDYIKDVKSEFKMIDYLKSWQILYKILKAYKSRTTQINKFLNKIQYQSDEKIILCCDMNDIPNSYAYHLLSSQFKDAYRLKGSGFSNTTTIPLPIYRIDYIFVNENSAVNSYQRLKTDLSDHHILVSHIL